MLVECEYLLASLGFYYFKIDSIIFSFMLLLTSWYARFIFIAQNLYIFSLSYSALVHLFIHCVWST